ncbi:hypothetical protein [Sulfurovum sp. AR]|uniref:hypothetical protein n=1 Tax=Sulfurovum sp. AR TaxID=1165841 RepID=UPI00025C4CB9|nr:hypothetical protein [Sulfurovum sp. AR]EIF51361.1 hypothetical protein SULAR_03917 [Sulfurovum sp. AR]
MKQRLDKLWKFISEHLEVNYGYLPKLPMDYEDDVRVDEYIEEIKNDFKDMREQGLIYEESRQESIDILKKLNDI